MDSSTTIKGMLSGKTIVVPDYQRSYSWRTATDQGTSPKEVNQFLIDLEAYMASSADNSESSPYYFGHFLYEEILRDEKYAVVDGQQRLTTIEIFLSALFKRLSGLRDLTDEELNLKDDLVKKRNHPNFRTVEYDNLFFQEYVIDQTRHNFTNLETESSRRIALAFNFFNDYLSDKGEIYIQDMLAIVSRASCTTHSVANESEAIQMFIFQNNRGKKPSNLEIIKAQFMYVVHLKGGVDTEDLIADIKGRFEKIYRSISSIDHAIDEDTVLSLTIRVYNNSLWAEPAQEWTNKQLTKANPIEFIRMFTEELSISFENLKLFYRDDRKYYGVDTMITFGDITTLLPFVLKAYKYDIPKKSLSILCQQLTCLRLRDKIIGTRADLLSRLNDVYKNFSQQESSIQEILDRIKFIKTSSSDSWWWAYWNNDRLKENIQGLTDRTLSKFILWQYENFLLSQGKSGYSHRSLKDIASPQLEHISPQTPTNNEPIAAGYDEYDENYVNECIDNLGNYLLLSASHNESIGNKPFIEKRASYTQLLQQREIMDLTTNHWGRKQIFQRQIKLVNFVLEHF